MDGKGERLDTYLVAAGYASGREKAQEIIALFKKYEMNDVTKISVSGESTVSAVYADRFEIKFGTMLDIEYKIKMCDKVLEEKISLDEKGTIDATQGGEIVYKRQ